MLAIMIKMREGCYYSQNLSEIDEIYISGCDNPGYYKKETIHEYLKRNLGTIQVNIAPYPDVIPMTSKYGEKYVRSSPNQNGWDNLLNLPRE